MVAAYDAQQARFAPRDDAWAGLATHFKADPHRKLDALLTKIASYLREDDALIDVGGGAGRLSLPLALRCREVVVIDPSAGMREVFEATAREAGITNARYVKADWLDPVEVAGDVALVTHVTYFVPRIAPFIEKLRSATRRRVIAGARSVPPPNQIAPFFKLVHDEELARVPGPDELRAVLAELGIDAELIDIGPAMLPATFELGATEEDAVKGELDSALRAGWLSQGDADRAGKLLHRRFADLFVKTERGYMRRSAVDARDLLITWETR
jgi:hypothetical protein